MCTPSVAMVYVEMMATYPCSLTCSLACSLAYLLAKCLCYRAVGDAFFGGCGQQEALAQMISCFSRIMALNLRKYDRLFALLRHFYD